METRWFSLIALAVVAVVVLGGGFALVYWLLGRGNDDDSGS